MSLFTEATGTLTITRNGVVQLTNPASVKWEYQPSLGVKSEFQWAAG